MSISDLGSPLWAFREGTSTDAGSIDAMLADLAHSVGLPEHKASTHDDLVRALSASNRFLHAIIAEVDGTDVGLCLWLPYYSSWRGRSGIFVQDLYASPAMRGRGLGTRLLNAAARQGGKLYGASFIRLAVDHANLGAARFYERIGFEPKDDDRHYDLDGEKFSEFAGART